MTRSKQFRARSFRHLLGAIAASLFVAVFGIFALVSCMNKQAPALVVCLVLGSFFFLIASIQAGKFFRSTARANIESEWENPEIRL